MKWRLFALKKTGETIPRSKGSPPLTSKRKMLPSILVGPSTANKGRGRPSRRKRKKRRAAGKRRVTFQEDETRNPMDVVDRYWASARSARCQDRESMSSSFDDSSTLQSGTGIWSELIRSGSSGLCTIDSGSASSSSYDSSESESTYSDMEDWTEELGCRDPIDGCDFALQLPKEATIALPSDQVLQDSVAALLQNAAFCSDTTSHLPKLESACMSLDMRLPLQPYGLEDASRNPRLLVSQLSEDTEDLLKRYLWLQKQSDTESSPTCIERDEAAVHDTPKKQQLETSANSFKSESSDAVKATERDLMPLSTPDIKPKQSKPLVLKQRATAKSNPPPPPIPSLECVLVETQNNKASIRILLCSSNEGAIRKSAMTSNSLLELALVPLHRKETSSKASTTWHACPPPPHELGFEAYAVVDRKGKRYTRILLVTHEDFSNNVDDPASTSSIPTDTLSKGHSEDENHFKTWTSWWTFSSCDARTWLVPDRVDSSLSLFAIPAVFASLDCHSLEVFQRLPEQVPKGDDNSNEEVPEQLTVTKEKNTHPHSPNEPESQYNVVSPDTGCHFSDVFSRLLDQVPMGCGNSHEEVDGKEQRSIQDVPKKLLLTLKEEENALPINDPEIQPKMVSPDTKCHSLEVFQRLLEQVPKGGDNSNEEVPEQLTVTQEENTHPHSSNDPEIQPKMVSPDTKCHSLEVFQGISEQVPTGCVNSDKDVDVGCHDEQRSVHEEEPEQLLATEKEEKITHATGGKQGNHNIECHNSDEDKNETPQSKPTTLVDAIQNQELYEENYMVLPSPSMFLQELWQTGVARLVAVLPYYHQEEKEQEEEGLCHHEALRVLLEPQACTTSDLDATTFSVSFETENEELEQAQEQEDSPRTITPSTCSSSSSNNNNSNTTSQNGLVAVVTPHCGGVLTDPLPTIDTIFPTTPMVQIQQFYRFFASTMTSIQKEGMGTTKDSQNEFQAPCSLKLDGTHSRGSEVDQSTLCCDRTEQLMHEQPFLRYAVPEDLVAASNGRMMACRSLDSCYE